MLMEKRTLGRPSRRWQDYSKIYLTEVEVASLMGSIWLRIETSCGIL